MEMNMLISKIAELFKDDNTISIYTYDKKILVYGTYFSNIELRKIWRIIHHEKILFELGANASRKVCIQLMMEE